MDNMNLADRLRTTPVNFDRTVRPDIQRTVTSGDAGKAIPLAFVPLLREDAMETSRVALRAYMDETADLLLNSVYAVFSAYFVPHLALDRFNNSMDALNRAYMGQPEADATEIPWIDTHLFEATPGTTREVYKTSGAHALAGTELVNTAYVQAYDKVFEFRCRQRSEALWEAVKADVDGSGNLHPAFFDNPQMGIVKASFDSAKIDGEVPLDIVSGRADVKAGVTYTAEGTDTISALDANGQNTTLEAAGGGAIRFRNEVGDALGLLYTELEGDGITMSVANIDLARETSAWAKVREQYSGLEDDDLIDLLMSGVRVPTAYQAQPMLLARTKVPFGMTQRYSSDAESLDVSATRGMAGAELALRVPQTNTGGTVVVMVEIVPEQFWERSADYNFLNMGNLQPDRLLDQLDPQAVEVVENFHADVAHTDPYGIFGYAPLNHQWMRRRFNLGGKFYKDDPLAAWSEDRNRIWASEPVDPTLSKEFFLATDLPKDIFMDSITDSFEFSAALDARISGLTFVGPMLREATGDYKSILDRVDMTRLTGDGVEATEVVEDAEPEPDTDEPCDETETAEETAPTEDK